MTDMPTFEAALEQRLRARSAVASRPFDATAIATAAVDANPTRRTGSWLAGIRPSLTWIAVLVGIALVAAALAAGRITQPPPALRPLLAIGDRDGFSFAEADGSRARLVRSEGPYFQPRWSPDGLFIAVTLLHPADANHLYVLRPDGSISAQAAGVEQFAWAPSGHQLATLGIDKRDFELLDPETNAVTNLTKPDAFPLVDSFDWSPDGSQLVIAARAEGDGAPASLWIIDRSDAPARRVTVEGRLVLPAWSPDGRFVAAVSGDCPAPPCSTEIRIYPVANGIRQAAIEDLQAPAGPLWSADSSMLVVDAIVGGQRDVVRYAIAESIVTRLTTSPGMDHVVGWDPGGATMVVMRQVQDGASSRSEFWRVAVDGSGEVRVVADAYGIALQPVP